MRGESAPLARDRTQSVDGMSCPFASSELADGVGSSAPTGSGSIADSDGMADIDLAVHEWFAQMKRDSHFSAASSNRFFSRSHLAC